MKRPVVLWLLSLVLVSFATAWISAQSSIVKRLDQPLMLSGSDVGIRVEAWDGTTAVGRIVVRVEGRWVEVNAPGGVVRLGQSHRCPPNE